MLAKKYRLNVQSVLRVRGTLMRGRYFTIKVLPAKYSYSRFAVVIGASAIKLATKRNALRRLLYTALKQRILTQPAVDVVITVQGAARDAAAHGILEELRSLLRIPS